MGRRGIRHEHEKVHPRDKRDRRKIRNRVVAELAIEAGVRCNGAGVDGLTVSVEPRRGFTDEMSGAPGDQYGADFPVLADRELIPGRLFAALNVRYEPEQTRLRGSGETLRESTLGIGAALAMQVMPNVFVGAEARSLRHYEGLGLNDFAGQALYIGPTPLRDLRRTIL